MNNKLYTVNREIIKDNIKDSYNKDNNLENVSNYDAISKTNNVKRYPARTSNFNHYFKFYLNKLLII